MTPLLFTENEGLKLVMHCLYVTHTQKITFSILQKIVLDFIVEVAISSTVYSTVTDATQSYMKSPLCPTCMITYAFSYLRGKHILFYIITPTIHNSCWFCDYIP